MTATRGVGGGAIAAWAAGFLSLAAAVRALVRLSRVGLRMRFRASMPASRVDRVMVLGPDVVVLSESFMRST